MEVRKNDRETALRPLRLRRKQTSTEQTNLTFESHLEPGRQETETYTRPPETSRTPAYRKQSPRGRETDRDSIGSVETQGQTGRGEGFDTPTKTPFSRSARPRGWSGGSRPFSGPADTGGRTEGGARRTIAADEESPGRGKDRDRPGSVRVVGHSTAEGRVKWGWKVGSARGVNGTNEGKAKSTRGFSFSHSTEGYYCRDSSCPSTWPRACYSSRGTCSGYSTSRTNWSTLIGAPGV